MLDPVEKFLARLRSSHPDMVRIYTQGGCYELFLILRTIWPQARCYYAMNPGHVYTEIDGRFYDIHGKYLRPPNGAVDWARREPRHMARAIRWSRRAFGPMRRTANEDLGNLLGIYTRPREELRGIPKFLFDFVDSVWFGPLVALFAFTSVFIVTLLHKWGY